MDENLIAQNPKDALVLKIRDHVDSRASAMDNEKKIYVYAYSLIDLARIYFRLHHDFLKKLDDKELANLSSLIYAKAKRRLWIHIPFFGLFSLISVLGLGVGIAFIYCGFINKRDTMFGTYKFVALHKWFWGRFNATDLRKGSIHLK